MAEFNPDEYLAGSGFNPDEYLGATNSNDPYVSPVEKFINEKISSGVSALAKKYPVETEKALKALETTGKVLDIPGAMLRTAVVNPTIRVAGGQGLDAISAAGRDVQDLAKLHQKSGEDVLAEVNFPTRGRIKGIPVNPRKVIGTIIDLGSGIGASALAKKISKALAVSHLRPTPRMKMALGEERVAEAADEALKDAIKPFTKADTTAKNLEGLVEDAGVNLGNIRKASKAQIDPVDIIKEVRENALEPLGEASANEAILRRAKKSFDPFVRKYAPEVGPKANLSLDMAEIEKKGFADLGDFRKPEPTAYQKAMQNISGIIRKSSEKAEPSAEFLAAKKKYGNLSNALDMTERTAALTDGGLMSQIGDIKAYQAAAELGRKNPLYYLIAPARELSKGRVSSTGAYGLDRIAPYIPLGEAGSVGSDILLDLYNEKKKP